MSTAVGRLRKKSLNLTLFRVTFKDAVYKTVKVEYACFVRFLTDSGHPMCDVIAFLFFNDKQVVINTLGFADTHPYLEEITYVHAHACRD